jgi:non-heme chloroperoxidase
MSIITTRDGTQIFYKDWGPKSAQTVVFHHGWPLSADDWDNQLLYFLDQGFRVVAHDRRGHGRSDHTDIGTDMDTYANDVIDLARALDLKNAVHVGHSTGGGEVTRYVARADAGRVSKAVLISAIPPVLIRKDSNPGGLPKTVFDGFRAALANNRSQFYLDVASGPFYNYDQPGVTPVEGNIRNWWRQSMMGAAKAHIDCIEVWSETDFTEDLKSIEVPVLLIHSEADQVVPYAAAAPLAVKLLKQGTLKTYQDLSHGMMTTHPDLINADILAFIRGERLAEAPAPQAGKSAEPVPA